MGQTVYCVVMVVEMGQGRCHTLWGGAWLAGVVGGTRLVLFILGFFQFLLLCMYMSESETLLGSSDIRGLSQPRHL